MNGDVPPLVAMGLDGAARVTVDDSRGAPHLVQKATPRFSPPQLAHVRICVADAVVVESELLGLGDAGSVVEASEA